VAAISVGRKNLRFATMASVIIPYAASLTVRHQMLSGVCADQTHVTKQQASFAKQQAEKTKTGAVLDLCAILQMVFKQIPTTVCVGQQAAILTLAGGVMLRLICAARVQNA